jgi:hypothetical protein
MYATAEFDREANIWRPLPERCIAIHVDDLGIESIFATHRARHPAGLPLPKPDVRAERPLSHLEAERNLLLWVPPPGQRPSEYPLSGPSPR